LIQVKGKNIKLIEKDMLRKISKLG